MSQPEPRIASHPDDPTAPLADRLLLALGMWPSYVEQIGADECVEAAVIIRTQAHKFPMAAEDFGTERELRDELVGALREIHETLSNAYGHAEAPNEPAALHALNLATEALDWVDNPAESFGD